MKFDFGIRVTAKQFGKDSLKSIIPLIILFTIGPIFYDNPFFFFLLAVLIVSTNALNIVYGFTGYLPFGFAVFIAFGAYLTAMAINILNFPEVFAILFGGLSSVALSMVFTPLLRLSGAYFAIASLGAFEVMYYFMSNLSLTKYTGGPYGIEPHIPYTPVADFIAIVSVAAVSSLIILFIHHSNFGLALKAISDDRTSAEMSGIHTLRVRTVAWALSSFLAGIAGALYGINLAFFYPSGVFDLTQFSVLVIVFLIFGGKGSYLGPLIGTVVLYLVYQFVTFNYPNFSLLVFGVIIVLLILFLSDGVTSRLKSILPGVF